jgi:hypothetical protein
LRQHKIGNQCLKMLGQQVVSEARSTLACPTFRVCFTFLRRASSHFVCTTPAMAGGGLCGTGAAGRTKQLPFWDGKTLPTPLNATPSIQRTGRNSNAGNKHGTG